MTEPITFQKSNLYNEAVIFTMKIQVNYNRIHQKFRQIVADEITSLKNNIKSRYLIK